MTALDGIITFFASHHAMRAERVLRQAGFTVRLVPGPRELSPSCGVALRFPFADSVPVQKALAAAGVELELLVHYPEAVAAPAGWAGLLRRRRGAAT